MKNTSSYQKDALKNKLNKNYPRKALVGIAKSSYNYLAGLLCCLFFAIDIKENLNKLFTII